ncbi:MAG: secretin N-terminal domain-containing protein, partial [bacterium]
MNTPVTGRTHPVRLVVCLSLLFLFLFISGPVLSQSAESLYSQAVGKYIDGDYKASLDLLNQLLEKDPDNSSAQRLLPQVKQKVSTSVLKKYPNIESAPDQSKDKTSKPGGLQESGISPESDKSKQLSPASDVKSPDGADKPPKPSQFKAADQPQEGSRRRPPSISDTPLNVIRHVNKDFSQKSRQGEALYGLVAAKYKDRIRVIVKASGHVGYLGSRIFTPPMIVVDFPNTLDRLPESPLPLEMGQVIRARHSQYREDPVRTSRLVIDLEQWNDRFRLYRNPNGGAVIAIFREKTSVPPETPMVYRPDQVISPDKRVSSLANIRKVRGDNQTLRLESSTSEPISLRVSDPKGNPIPGETVTFSIKQGSGELRPTDGTSSGTMVTTVSNQAGFASVNYHSDTKAGITVVKARVPAKNLSLSYRLTVKPGPATQLKKVSGDRQSTLFGQSVPKKIIVEAQDEYGNPVPGVQLKFDDVSGKGLLDLSADSEGIQVRATTNDRGRVVVDRYRTASELEENKVTVRTYRRNENPLKTTFLIYGQPQLITIDFESANLQDVLRTLAQISNWNIALSGGSGGSNLSERTITVNLEQVTALRALDTILDVKGLSRVSDGNVMKIVSKKQALKKGVSVISPEELSDYPANNIVTVAFKLQFLEASSQLAQQLKSSLMADNSTIVADQKSNSLIITDLANNLRRIKRILEGIDRQDQLYSVRVFELKQRDPKDLENSIKSLLPTGQGNVVAHRATNTLLVYADPNLMDRIESLIKKLDTRNPIARNMTTIDVEGYDVEELAQRINTILGVQVIPVDELSFDIKSAEEASKIASGA